MGKRSCSAFSSQPPAFGSTREGCFAIGWCIILAQSWTAHLLIIRRYGVNFTWKRGCGNIDFDWQRIESFANCLFLPA
jgi:hypothetical protein